MRLHARAVALLTACSRVNPSAEQWQRSSDTEPVQKDHRRRTSTPISLRSPTTLHPTSINHSKLATAFCKQSV